MRWRVAVSVILMFSISLFAQPSTTTAPADGEVIQLDAGRLRLTIPDGWKRVPRDEDDKGMSAVFQRIEGPGLMSVSVDTQEDVVVEEHARKMAKSIGEQIREAAKTNGVTLLYGPKLEPDSRFLLKINTRMDVPERGVVDETHLYRVMGLNLVYLNVTSDTESEDEARKIRESAEQFLADVQMAAGPRPSSFPRTRIKVFVPPDWKEQRTDNPNATVAVWREPNNGAARIVLKSRVLPKEAREGDLQKRDARLEELLKSDSKLPPIPGLVRSGEPEVTPGSGAILKQATQTYEQSGKTWIGRSRYFVVDDVVLGLTIVAPEGTELDMAATVDEMASRIESLNKPKPE